MVYRYYHSTSKLIKVEPVFIGDTIRVRVTIKEKKDSPKRPEYGIVSELVEVFNQHEQVVLAGEHLLFVRKKTLSTRS